MNFSGETAKTIKDKINSHLRTERECAGENGLVLCVSGESGIGKYTALKTYAHHNQSQVETIELESLEDIHYLVWCSLKVRRMFYSTAAPVKLFLIKNIEDCKTVRKISEPVMIQLLKVFHSGKQLPVRCDFGPISAHVLAFTCHDIYSDQCKQFRSHCSSIIYAKKLPLAAVKGIFSGYDPKLVQRCYEISKGNLRQMESSLRFSKTPSFSGCLSGSDTGFSTDYNTASFFLGNYRETSTIGKPYYQFSTREQLDILFGQTSPLTVQLVRENLQNGIKFKALSLPESMEELANSLEIFSFCDHILPLRHQFLEYDDCAIESLAIVGSCRLPLRSTIKPTNVVLKYPKATKKPSQLVSDLVKILENNRMVDLSRIGPKNRSVNRSNRDVTVTNIVASDRLVYQVNQLLGSHAWVVCLRYLFPFCELPMPLKKRVKQMDDISQRENDLVDKYQEIVSCINSFFTLSDTSDGNMFPIFDSILNYGCMDQQYRDRSTALRIRTDLVERLRSKHKVINSKISLVFGKNPFLDISQPIAEDNTLALSAVEMKPEQKIELDQFGTLESLRSLVFSSPLEYLLWYQWVNSKSNTAQIQLNSVDSKPILGKRPPDAGSPRIRHKKQKL